MRILICFFAILSTYLSGSLMFSFWLGKIILKKDIRKSGDANPGASNVFRVGGKIWGFVALTLDYVKGFIPVLLWQNSLNLRGWPLILLAISPVLGHAYSPWLFWRGGKAIAVTFGIWSGLTLWRVPTIFGLILTLTSTKIEVSSDGWKVILGMMVVLIFLLLATDYKEYYYIWFLNLLILCHKHWQDLKQPLVIKWRKGS